METKKTSIYTALLEFQKKGISIKKSSDNPHFKNSYADINEVLEKVRPALSEVGIVLTQTLDPNGLKTILYDTASETQIESYLEFSQKGDPQKLGSNITYYRRYAIVAMLALEAEDDDGNVASTSTPAARPAQRPAAPAAPAAPAMTPELAIGRIAQTTSLAQLKSTWDALPSAVQKDPEVAALKEQRKTDLINATQ